MSRATFMTGVRRSRATTFDTQLVDRPASGDRSQDSPGSLAAPGPRHEAASFPVGPGEHVACCSGCDWHRVVGDHDDARFFAGVHERTNGKAPR